MTAKNKPREKMRRPLKINEVEFFPKNMENNGQFAL